MDKQPWERDRRHVHPDDAQSKFERWVRLFGGPSALARQISVHEVTVGLWIGRRGSPNLATAKKILDLSDGYLSIDDIIDGTRAW